MRGLNKEALEISVRQGDVELKGTQCTKITNKEMAISGTGWVIRNSSGWFQLGGGRGGVRVASSLAIESMAVREALWAYVEKVESNCGV
ncbi:hypothetical protein DVH24_026277 [Malus domestica]|uniref:Uncharacterized protein n=1 Tax=Malus domestica TaxID=3750 RepID=A0A498KIY7_MALDO|nr:hypothetical protein DVH24_026277 [Malus domestica]